MSEVVPLFAQEDLDSCDREPIHVPGSIQPHGALLVVDRDEFGVQQYAGDIRFMLGVEATRLQQLSLAGLFDENVLLQILRQVHSSAPLVQAEVLLGVSSRTGALPLDLTVHAWHQRVIIEIEPARRTVSVNGDPLARVKSMIASLSSAQDVAETCGVAARRVRELTGFDRVNVYQFLPDGSGKVIAEDHAPGIDSFLGLHYPASDIPQQAREMYRRTWIRAIPDIDYWPAPVRPCAGASEEQPLDMTYCGLRSVSPIHLEYLRNMGVTASMSLSIIVDEKLWGLIACHNYMPRYLATDLRVACELYAQIFSLHLTAKIETDAAQRRIAPRAVQAELANRIGKAADLVAELLVGDVSLLDLIPATGVALLHEGRLLTRGETPSEDAIRDLSNWLNGGSAPIFQSSFLSEAFAPAAAYRDVASGLLAVAVARGPSSYVMWFRPELTRTVKWAGNPAKTIEHGPHGARLTPRKSFDAWQLEVLGQSLPWDVVEVDAANAFRVWVLETVLGQMDVARREREALFARQNVLLAELDHRVKNTLSRIHGMVRQSKSTARSLEQFVGDLEKRIIAMGNAHALLADNHWDGVSLRGLIDKEIAALGSSRQALVHVEGNDCSLSATATMTLSMVFHELLGNAERHGALSVPGGSIKLAWERQDGDGSLVIRWKECDGPPVAQPLRRGFGTAIIERSLGFELKGSSAVTYAVDGLACTITIPRAQLVTIASN